MTCYSVQPRDWIFVKGYGFLSFTLKTASKRAIQKTPEATGDLNRNKIVDSITKVLKTYWWSKIKERELLVI